MPLEDQAVATTYIDQQPVVKDMTADVTSASSEFFRGKKNNKEAHVRVNLDNEFNSQPSVTIDVREPIILEAKDDKGLQVTEDLTEQVQREFLYLSATKGLEIGSARSDILQEYIDKMVQGNTNWEGKVRVVIMNKGQEPTAFAYPDGTIFISQSLINLYDSLDEVVGILAHEVKHITNGTTRAAFNSKVKHGTSLGVDWLHEMTSDFGAPELLEKVGLKSTATADVLTKLADHFGNRRGTEHQAPVMRAIQQLGVHAVKDYETSHIDYTDLPPELMREPRMTNFEAIIDAAVRDDVEAVEQYLPLLHPRDLGTFFDVADNGSYYGLSEVYPERDTEKEIAKKVGAIVVQRLLAEGRSENEIKLFFLSTTRGYSHLSPSFKNVADLTSYITTAQTMFENDTVSQSSEKLFRNSRKGDPLRDLIYFISYRFDSFTDKDAVFFTDISELAQFIGEVNNLTQDGLPAVKDGSFVDDQGNILRLESNRSAQFHEDLKHIIFNYIERYYLAHVPDGELDQDQIEDIFRAVQEVGYEPLTSSYYFPIKEESIGPGNKKIIEIAYRRVFGKELVRRADGKEITPLPSPTEFRAEIEGKSRWDVEQLLKQYAYDHELDTETRAEYVRVGLDYLNDYNFARTHLESLVQDEIGYSAMKNWRENGDPKWDTFSRSRAMNSMRTRLKNAFDQSSGNEPTEQEEPKPRKLSIDDVIAEYGLDRETLYAEARKRGEVDRTSSQIEFVANTIAVSETHLFDFVDEIMRDTKADVGSMDQFQLLAMCHPLFKLANEDDRGAWSRDKITDFERFYQLRFVQEIVQQIEQIHFENVQDLLAYIKDAKSRFSQRPVNARFSLYEDDVYSVLLAKPVRDELLRLSEPSNIRQQDYPILVELLNEHFPYSPQRRELVKALQTAYINNPEIPIKDKIDFFLKEYKLLGFEGAILVAEQITDVTTYREFKAKLDELALEYVSGEESLDGVATTDIASSVLTQRADLLVKTASGSSSVARETSTDLAIQWVKTYLGENEWRRNDIQYDKKTGKFILTEAGRSAFATFNDTIDYFRNLPESKKLAIALKAMSDQDGLLVSGEGRQLLERMLVDGLGLSDPFFRSVLSNAIKSGDAKVVGLPAAQMLIPFMFRSLSVGAVDVRRVRAVELRERNDGSYTTTKVKNKEFSEDLPAILSAGTRDIRYFGFRYKDQPQSTIGVQAQESGQVYFDTLSNLNSRILIDARNEQVKESSNLPPATEAIIKAGETSPVFVRGMQMAVQLIDFDPAIQDRLSQTQDSMKGMEKLRFWDNLLSKAQGDPELARFIEEDLISLDSYLGGGSLFTTYGATVRGEGGTTQKIVIKMLNPNAEEFIRLSYGFSSTVLGEVEQQTRGKTRQNARFAGSLLELSNTWCIRDINDDQYEQRDDAFRTTVETFNQQRGQTAVEAPERVYTSKKVKVEGQYQGTTLNKFLNDPTMSAERKAETVDTLLAFFDHQFDFSPMTSPDGKRIFIFHSDPHAGNYMIDPSSSEQRLGAIDRSMYLALGEQDVEMFKLLKSGENAQFINFFIARCLEVSGIEGREATRIRYGVLNQLGGELVRQRLRGRNDTAAFLQVILQEFAKYGERYSFNESQDDLSDNESTIVTFLTANPETDIVAAYDSLRNQLFNGGNGNRELTFVQFKDLVKKMTDRGLITRKAIDVPLDYRLMIRNIVAMKNLGDRWT
jgi:hypothetical protein